ERQATALAPVLEIATSDAEVRRAMNRLPAARDGLVAVHRFAGSTTRTIGASRAREEDLQLARVQNRPLTGASQDGDLLLQPAALGADEGAVVEVGVPRADLTRGVSTAWGVMAVVAVVLVAASVLVADRLAARLVRASGVLAAAARRLGNGDLDVRITPGGPAELVEAGGAFNAMADRGGELLAAERELGAGLSRRRGAPLAALQLDAEAVGASPAARRLRHAAQQLEREIDAIIRTARSPLNVGLGGSCDAAEVIRTRMRFWSALATDQNRPCEVIGTDRPVPV